MKILYGVQGTGNGHISRARMMARHFARKGADVDWVFTGREPGDYFDMEIFGNYRSFRGLTFSTRAGRVRYLQTALSNNLPRLVGDIRSLDLTPYDLVITDFEPLSAWAGRRAGKRVIGIGHQYAFNYPVPREGDNPAARLIMRWFAPADTSVGLHWSDFGAPIAPPIVDPDLGAEAAETPHVLVYLPFEDQQRVTQLLQRCDSHRFIQYSSSLTDAEQGNVSLRKACLDGFKQDLRSARAVICNAGFELVSECLHLGLPVLVKPLDGQMEQQSNAAALTRLGLGQRCAAIEESCLRPWLDAVPAAPPVNYPDVADALTDWILEGCSRDAAHLARSLWEPGAETPAS